MMELSEDFLKILIMCITVIVILGIFLIFNTYNIVVINKQKQREAALLGDLFLSAECIIEHDNNGPIKGLFSEKSLDNLDDLCIDYPNGRFTVSTPQKEWTFVLGPYGSSSAIFNVALRLTTGEVVPAQLEVNV